MSKNFKDNRAISSKFASYHFGILFAEIKNLQTCALMTFKKNSLPETTQPLK